MHAPSIWGILVVAVVVILLFGRGKISGMMGEVAQGIKAFQKGMKDEEKPVERVTTTADVDAREVDAREVDKSKDA
jgi:twin arginine-targeting protein translocase, TatA/E family